VESVGEEELALRLAIVGVRVSPDHARERAPTLVKLSPALPVLAPRLLQLVVVLDVQRAVEPGLEGLSVLPGRAFAEVSLGNVLDAQTSVALHGGGRDALAQSQVAHVAVADPEDVALAGGVGVEGEAGDVLLLAQYLGWLDESVGVAPVVVEDVGVVPDELDVAVLDAADAAADRRHQVGRRVLLAGHEVDDRVDVALLVELVRRHADVLGALLPGQLVLAGNAGQTPGMNGVEDAVAYAEEDVGGRQRYGTAGVTIADDDADDGNVDLRELGDQPGDGVGLVVLVGLGAGIGAGGVHEGHDGHGQARELADDVHRAQVVLGHPHAVPRGPLLGQKADATGVPLGELQHHLLGQEGAHLLLANHLAGEALEDALGAHPLLAFARGDGSLDVGVDVQATQLLETSVDLPLAQHPAQLGEGGVLSREEREVAGKLLRFEKELVDAGMSSCHEKSSASRLVFQKGEPIMDWLFAHCRPWSVMGPRASGFRLVCGAKRPS